MKKTFKMSNLDCANCAAKMEEQIKKLDGVNSVSVSFMLQKITLDVDEYMLNDVLLQANAICKKIHRTTSIVF